MKDYNYNALLTDISNFAYPMVKEHLHMTEETATEVLFTPWADIIIEKMKHESNGQFSLRYYELIHNFCTYRIAELSERVKTEKEAMLVSLVLTTRVVVDKNEDAEAQEDAAIKKALEKFRANPMEYLIQDNFDQCVTDQECPFGSLNEDYEINK